MRGLVLKYPSFHVGAKRMYIYLPFEEEKQRNSLRSKHFLKQIITFVQRKHSL